MFSYGVHSVALVCVTENLKLMYLPLDQPRELDEATDTNVPLVTVKEDPGETATVVPLFDTFRRILFKLRLVTFVSKSQTLKMYVPSGIEAFLITDESAADVTIVEEETLPEADTVMSSPETERCLLVPEEMFVASDTPNLFAPPPAGHGLE